MQMGYTILHQSGLCLEEARRSIKAKEKLQLKIELLKLKVRFDSHPKTFQPHPPTPSNTTRSGFPTNNLLLKQDLQSNADPHPATFQPHPPAPSNTTPSHLPTNNLPTKLRTTPSRRLDRDHYTHYLIRQALFKSAGKPNPATLHK